MGSNPIEDASSKLRRGTVRKPAKRRSSNLRGFVGSTPTRATTKSTNASAGHWRAQVAVTHPPAGQCRFDSCPTHCFRLSSNSARSSIGTGQRPLKPQRRVRFPHGSLMHLERDEKQKSGSTGQLTLAARRAEGHPTVIGQVVKLADTRRSERRALWGLGVRLSPWSIRLRRIERREVRGEKTNRRDVTLSALLSPHSFLLSNQSRWASAQWSLISSKCRVRHPDLLMVDDGGANQRPGTQIGKAAVSRAP